MHIVDKVLRHPAVKGKHTLAIVVADNVLLAHLALGNLYTVTLCQRLECLGIAQRLVLH